MIVYNLYNICMICISMYLYNIYHNTTVERSQAMVEMQGEVTCLSEAEGSSETVIPCPILKL